MSHYPKPSWEPSIAQTVDWTIQKLHEYLPNKKLVVFSNGTFVLWQDSGDPNVSESKKILKNVVTSHPDFKVRKHSSGDFLVTFKGGVGGVVSGKLLQEHMSVLREQALSEGKLPSEIIQSEIKDVSDDDLIAGLYARARLYLDVESSSVVATVV